MKYHELTIYTTEEAVEMISNFLHEQGAGGVSIEESGSLERRRDLSFGQWYELPLNDIPEGNVLIKGYFSEEEDMDAHVAAVRPRIEELREYEIDPGQYEISVFTVDENDWATAWKQYFKPIRVTERLTIKPTWEEYEASEGEVVLEIDPGMAFGTGTHPTTSLCLRALESTIREGDEVIDVGTGSGILAIGAVKVGAGRVLAVDLDPVAVSSAIENASLNGLEDRIQVLQSDLLGVLKISSGEASSWSDNANPVEAKVRAELAERAINEPLLVSVPCDVIVANILAEIILLFLDDVYAALKPGGTYIASGIYENKEETVASALLASGFEIVDRVREDKWIAFVAAKPKEEG
ncbi:50S ribosomal protein L11 methyltransferase [Paenibacillus pasadenensis]|uniref:50S ribosomal protein L11 methyltransferase n=1 Tax=Paenibacillus pasadenensis TaxID=217090 RepID=UPI00203BB361|nr:50S ribosomal protein L11 methyltransferase [Paenibacillus pasadenensis]MCM3746387.1 50S ribosomal protein L11 methyltransferase [Paenibacillus pasadenensis]